MPDYKIMFWNIQNVYDYKIVLPEELALESGISGDPSLSTKRLKKLDSSAKKMTVTKETNSRATVTHIIDNVNPDMVIIVEFSVGKSDLVGLATDKSDSTGRKRKRAEMEFDHWGPRQYQVDLNQISIKLSRDRQWASALSQVNASDLLVTVGTDDTVTGVTHKNTMFELYGILWDETKLKLKDPLGFQIVSKDATGACQNFPERNPGFATFTDPSDETDLFSVAMIHSVFGKGSVSAVETARANAILYLSRLKAVNDVLAAKKPMLIAGDFNLDFDDKRTLFNPLIGTETDQLGMNARISGKTSIAKPSTTNPGYHRNAYDNIFTKGFKNDTSAGAVYDFVEEGFTGIEAALLISDHLPVYATVSV